MDQALKARLIGAVILVGLGVLVIPELLSGRKSAPAPQATTGSSPASRTITIELGAQGETDTASGSATSTSGPVEPAKAPATTQASVDAKNAGTDDMPAAGSTAEPASSSGAASVRTQTSAPPGVAAPGAASSPATTAVAKPAISSAQKPPSGTGRTWSVQVGAFSSASAAEKLANELDGAGYSAYVAARQGKGLHRVRVGPVTDRAEADRLASRLKSRGLPVAVVAND